MLRSKPISKYCGLTVILSNPSRFDNARLLTAGGGHVLGMHCLQPEFNLNMCDIRLVEDMSQLLEGTKCVLICGEYAMHKLLPYTCNNTLNEMRGSLLHYNNLPVICSYFPQDCADIKSYEAQSNPASKDFMVEDEGEDEGEEAAKTHGRTKRSNYAFWLRSDVRKCKTIITTGVPKKEWEPKYVSCPDSGLVIQELSSARNQYLHLDIETDREETNLQCFSFSFEGRTIYNVPVLDYSYRPFYQDYTHIIRALAVAISKNITVAHNGACFDFFVLGHKYRIPVNRVYDTMVAMHRCFPDVEKSLGHGTSYWTWEIFHKDTDSHGYRTKEQMMARLAYCGKDVYTMFLIKQAIDKYARTIPGLQDSIDTAMDSIVPYLTTTLQGIEVDVAKKDEFQNENDRLMTQYIRIMNILIGDIGLAQVRSAIQNGKAKSLAASNKQCVKYFHDILGYPTVARSPKTGEPSLGKNAMFKLALKVENPVINTILAYRNVAKEWGTLNFTPWKE